MELITILHQSNIKLIFFYGLLLSITLPIIGMYLLSRKQGFIIDVAGHAYFGAYLLILIINSILAYFSSFLTAYLLARPNYKKKIQESQAQVLIIYISFTVFMLAIVNIFKPEALDMLVFGNIFSANYLNILLA
ncbi:MAG: hypothetical protein GXN99_01945, partial [Candidatus Nanohaloarchaeota archaeon]|nr:hypothetical protein [Candidatus Nanohaloarchaeota archaeon]